MNDITRDDGLTDAEGVVMDALCDATNAFRKLRREHPTEMRDFADAIHRCQDLLTLRIARRHYPEGWLRVCTCGAKILSSDFCTAGHFQEGSR